MFVSKYDTEIKAILEKMTFQEKVGQMTQFGTSIYSADLKLNPQVADLIRQGRMGSFLSVTGVEMMNEMQRIAVEESRLGIPLFFAHDIIHGYRVLYPVPSAESCSFQPELAEENARLIAKESRANGFHVTWAPMMDIARDQRWGRGFEGSGEDVYLGCEFAKARVRGFQNDDLKSNHAVAACAKHYVGYGAVAGGRDYNSVDMSDNMLYNEHLPAFRQAVDEGVEFVMTAFHDFNGVPCTANKKLLQDILRQELGFEGIIISDANSLRDILRQGYAEDVTQIAQRGIDAGLDIEMCSTKYLEGMVHTPENEAAADKAVYRILDLKYRLGLFENPYTDTSLKEKYTALPEYVTAARDTARRSIVLLENNGVLPIQEKKVAVIGALAEDQKFAGGGWVAADPTDAYARCVTILEGVRNCDSFASVTYAPAYTYIKTNEELMQKGLEGDDTFFETSDALIFEALSAANQADVILLVAGESTILSGEAKSRMDLSLPEAVKQILKELKVLNKPIVLLVTAGRPLLVGEVAKDVDGLLFSYALGSQAGNAVADVLSGAYNPSAKLVNTIPSANGQGPLMYYSQGTTGKPFNPRDVHTSKYIDGPNMPAYCFGYGKSYTDFCFDGIKTDKTAYAFGDTIRLCVTVTNTGAVDGEDVVQVYMRDCCASISRPQKQLIGFRKMMIPAGESAEVAFDLDTNKMGFWMDRQYVLEPGRFLLFAGGDSNAALYTEITIQ